MLNLLKKNYLFLLFSFFLILYSSLNNIGPWDEYHLLYYFKNKLFFPFYDSNFTYYDTYLLGRFSPITGQEFNIPIFLGLGIDNSFFLISIIILSTLAIYFYTLGYFYNYYDKKIFILFVIFIISSPSFYLLSSRLLYAEDMSALLIIIFLCSFLKCINLENSNLKIFWHIFLVITIILTLLYKENNFVILIFFGLSYFFFDYKRRIINKNTISIIIILTLIYLLILIYINVAYKSNDLAYVQNLNLNFLTNSFLTLIRYSIFNDPILFLIIIPLGLISLQKSKNTFFKSMFVSGIMNILFFISLGLYGPYYLYVCYFLLFPLFYEGVLYFLKFINFKKKLAISFMIFVVFLSFLNSIFYYFESKSISITFNNTVKYLTKNIKENKNITKIFICNNLTDGNLAHVYILGEHIKYNNIDVDQFEFYSLKNNSRNILNSKISPFDGDNINDYKNSIFQDRFKKSLPQKGDLMLNFYSYSSNKKDNCSFYKHKKYKEAYSNTISFTNTLISNLIKVLIYKKEFNKVYFSKKFGYTIFKIK
jgi:hypothetical protein